MKEVRGYDKTCRGCGSWGQKFKGWCLHSLWKNIHPHLQHLKLSTQNFQKVAKPSPVSIWPEILVKRLKSTREFIESILSTRKGQSSMHCQFNFFIVTNTIRDVLLFCTWPAWGWGMESYWELELEWVSN